MVAVVMLLQLLLLLLLLLMLQAMTRNAGLASPTLLKFLLVGWWQEVQGGVWCW